MTAMYIVCKYVYLLSCLYVREHFLPLLQYDAERDVQDIIDIIKCDVKYLLYDDSLTLLYVES